MLNALKALEGLESDEKASMLFGVTAVQELKDKDPTFSYVVRHLTPADIIRFEFNTSAETRDYLNSWRQQIEDSINWDRLEIPEERWINKPCYELVNADYENMSLACINFDIPDVILIEHFKQFLAARRAQINPQKRSRLPSFTEWCRLGILPYLDLKIWEKENNMNIPNRVMADAIYQSGEGGEETVRKTTAPLADFLITERSLEILSAQVANEIAEANS